MKIRTILAALSLSVLPLAAMADPAGIKIDVSCPVINSTSVTVGSLLNFGDYIAGYGSENVQGITREIYFKSEPLRGDQIDLSKYQNAGTAYNSINGKVSCEYRAPGSPESASVRISYKLTNGRGGVIESSNMEKISILLPVGF